MTNNVLIQLQGIIERSLRGVAKLSKSFRKFFIETMVLYTTMTTRINYTSMARCGKSSEGRFRSNFRKPFDWLGYNLKFIPEDAKGHLTAIAIDPSYISKSGKKTPGLSYFWSGCAQAAKRGLEILGIAFIDATEHTATHLKAVQTIKGRKRKGRIPKWVEEFDKRDSLTVNYLYAIYDILGEIRKLTHTVVADAYFANGPFANAIRGFGLHLVSRLHDNVCMRYLYEGEQKKVGRKKMYDGKVDINNLRPDVFHVEIGYDSEGRPVTLYVGEVWVNCLDMKVKVVVADLSEPGKKTQVRKIFFSTDTSLSGAEIFLIYRSRFLIEFLYRDGKNFTGLTHCQARSEEALDFSFNASLSSLNLMRQFARENGYGSLSNGSIKTMLHNAYFIEMIFSRFGKSANLKLIDTDFKELVLFGVRDAC